MPPCSPGSFAHPMKRGDTLYDLARTYKTSVSELFAANPGVVMSDLRPGQTICIPLKQQSVSKAQMNLHDQWRELWEQHVAWTRMAILGDLFDSPGLPDTLKRLLRNPTDMAGVMRRYYGADNADRFESLMRTHLLIAVDLVNAAKSGKNDAAAVAERKWYANADEIATFLSHLNPYWPYEAIQSMLYRHLGMTKDEAVAILKKDYKGSIEQYDRIEQQALEMADALPGGIIKQFPGLFR